MADLILKGFDKVDEFTDPELLKPTTLTRLENMVLDSQLNKPVKRGGFSTFNSNDAAGGIYSIKDLVDSSGNNIMIGVSASDGKSILKSAAGTAAWGSLKTMTTANAKLKVASYNGKHFITNGTDTPFSTDLTTNTDLLLTSPDVSSSTAAHNAGGNLTPNAKYYWVIAYITSEGEISPPSAWMTHHYTNTSNNTTTAGYQSITLASLPVSSDARVVGRLLYRTKADELVPFLLTRLDNVSTTYTDEAADTLLDLSQTVRYGQTVNTCKYLVTHKERLFMGYLNLTDFAPKMIRDGWVSNGTNFNATQSADAGALPAGVYKYRVCFIDKLGNVSGYIEDTINLAADKQIILYNIPQSIGEGIEVQLFRSKKDVFANNTDFFFLMSNPGETEYDEVLDAALPAGTMPAATTSTSSYSSGILYSEIGKPAQIPSENLLLVYPDDGDIITGLIDDEDGLLVIKQNSICKLYTRGEPISWEIHKVVSQIGCDQPLSIQKIGNRVYFLNNKQLYRYPDSINAPVNKDLTTTLGTVTAVNDSAYSNFYQWYVLIVTCTSTKYILIYNEKLDTWYKFSAGGLSWECVTEKLYGSDRGKLIFGHTGINTLLKYDETVSLDAAAEIFTYLRTKTFISSDPNALFRLRILWANYKKKNSQNINHSFWNPEGNLAGSISSVATDVSANKFTKASHGLANDDRVFLSAIVSTTNISAGTIYFVVGVSGADFQLSLILGGSAIDLTGSNGTVTVQPCITNADTTDSTLTGGYKDYRIETDRMTPAKSLTIVNKLIYQADGAGLTEFNGAKIKYREISRGQR